MFLNNLFEALDQRHAAFCFGRMNPPTEGHQQLINTVAQEGRGSNFFIFTSQTQDRKKNPLDYQTKVRFLRALYPGIASHIVYDTNLKTIMQVAAWLYNKGFRTVTFVAGSDRLPDFEELLTKYNGVKGSAVYYKFDSIRFVSSGDRDPDSEGVEGISASAARAAASAGDFEAFSRAVGAGKLTQELYDAVRKGMNISDSVTEGTFTDSEVRYMPGQSRGERSSSYTWKHDDKYGWHVRDPKGVVVYKSSETNSFKAKEEVKAKAAELNKSDKLNEFARDGFNGGGDDDEGFSPAIAKMAEEDGFSKGVGLADVATLARAMAINAWDTQHGGLYKQYFAKGFKEGRSNKVQHDNKRYNLNLTVNKDGSISQNVAEDASGYIPKNKKEAKDPRWSNALSVDVKPDTPTKNAKALRLG